MAKTRADLTPTLAVRFLRGTLVNGKHVSKGAVLKVDFGAFDYFTSCGAAVEYIEAEAPAEEVVKTAEVQVNKAKAKTK